MERNDGRAEGNSDELGQAENALMAGELNEQMKAFDRLKMTQFSLDRAADAIFWIEPDARLFYVNDTACRSLGYSREELLSMTVYDIDPDFQETVWAKSWERLRRQGSFTIESVHRAKDGRTFPVEIAANYLNYGGKECDCAFVRDITERKRAEEQIRISEQRYRALADNIGLGIAHVDIDHNIIMVNSTVGRMLDRDPSEFVGNKCYEMFDENRKTCSHCPGDEALRTGKAAETETEGIRKDGSRFPVRLQAYPLFAEDGRPTGFIEVAEDITDRKRSEEAIRSVISCSSAQCGSRFFQTMADQLAKTLDADFAFIGELADDKGTAVRTIAVCADGRTQPDFEYDLKGTPCANVVGQAVCSHASGVCEKFPSDILLREMGVEAYVGVPLFDSQHKALGIMVTLFRHPLDSTELAESILGLFATRIAAEIERSRSEEALRESERRYRRIVEDQIDLIVRWLPGGIRTFANDSYCRYFGKSRDQVIGTSFFEQIPKAGHEAIRSKIESLTVENPTATGEHRVIRADGSIGWNQWIDRAIFDDEGKLVEYQSVGRDITDRKQAEEEIEKIFNMTGYMICVASLTGYFTRVNASFEQTLGYSSEELLSRPYLDFVHPDDKERTVVVAEENLAKGAKIIGFENRYLCKDGSYKWLSWASQPVLEKGITYAIAYDITDRKLAEEAARETQERFSDFFKNAPIGFHIVGPDQVVIDINEAELAMIGYEREEVVGKMKWPELIVPEEKQQFEKHWHDITTMGHARNLEYTLMHKDGYRIDVILNASSRFDRQGNFVSTRGSVLNITARKHAEQARHRLIKECEVKHQELESILYAASHDLRSPLVNIHGFSHQLSESCDLVRAALTGEKKNANMEKAVEVALNKDIPDALDFILTSTTKMDSLLSGLLDVCRLNTATVKIEPIDMDAMMADVVASIGYQIEKAGVKVDIEPLPHCLGDTSQINRVFTNLLTNALKFLRESGPGHIRIYGRNQGNQSIYGVEDNGIGIAPEHLEKIFEIFYQLEPQERRGEGIGLAIVRRIIDRHNGKVWVESKVGVGSKFFVALPGA